MHIILIQMTEARPMEWIEEVKPAIIGLFLKPIREAYIPTMNLMDEEWKEVALMRKSLEGLKNTIDMVLSSPEYTEALIKCRINVKCGHGCEYPANMQHQCWDCNTCKMQVEAMQAAQKRALTTIKVSEIKRRNAPPITLEEIALNRPIIPTVQPRQQAQPILIPTNNVPLQLIPQLPVIAIPKAKLNSHHNFVDKFVGVTYTLASTDMSEGGRNRHELVRILTSNFIKLTIIRGLPCLAYEYSIESQLNGTPHLHGIVRLSMDEQPVANGKKSLTATDPRLKHRNTVPIRGKSVLRGEEIEILKRKENIDNFLKYIRKEGIHVIQRGNLLEGIY